MDTNFHAFVFIATFVVYVILKSYKKTEPENKKTSNLIYVLFVPLILYGGHYYYNRNTPIPNTITNSHNSSVSEDLLTTPYPVSSDSLSI